MIAAEDAAFLTDAADALPPAPWDGTTYAVWIKAVKARSGRAGKGLFLPLRRALTGCDSGPELAALLPLMGFERVAGRLRGAAT